ncbi:MAG: hypothetical protein ACK2T3_15035, partial [Candidatus Promineifilaceae bacterium]
ATDGPPRPGRRGEWHLEPRSPYRQGWGSSREAEEANPPVLPESGADVAPSLLIAAAIGVMLLAAGAGIIIKERRS